MKDYGGATIELHRRHPLWGVIAATPRGRGRGDGYDRSYPFTFPPDADVDLKALGRTLHSHHVERMMWWTQSLYHGHCLAARTAIDRFYKHYDIDDTDYDFSQTAYKAWQRWKERYEETVAKTLAKRATFAEKYVLRNSQDSQAPTNAELELRCDQVAMRLFELRPDAPDYLFRQVQLFIWRTEGGRSADELAELFQIHRANVYRAVGKVKDFARHEEGFRSIFE